MFTCPNCQNRLSRIQNQQGIFWACRKCGGRAASVPLLRQVLAGQWHLASNLYFLVVFGDKVEDFLGWRRLFLLVVFAALAGDFLHVLALPKALMTSGLRFGHLEEDGPF